MTEEHLTQGEAQKYLRISLNTILKLRDQGLPFIKIGKKVLFRKSDIDAFVESKRIIQVPKKPKK